MCEKLSNCSVSEHSGYRYRFLRQKEHSWPFLARRISFPWVRWCRCSRSGQIKRIRISTARLGCEWNPNLAVQRRLILTLSDTVDARYDLVTGEAASNRAGMKLPSDHLPDARGLETVLMDREHIRLCAHMPQICIWWHRPLPRRKWGPNGDPVAAHVVDSVVLSSSTSQDGELGFADNSTVEATPERCLRSWTGLGRAAPGCRCQVNALRHLSSCSNH